MRWDTKYTCRWPILLVISMPKIFVNGQLYFNLSSKMWSHVFLEHSVVPSVALGLQHLTTLPAIRRSCSVYNSHGPTPVETARIFVSETRISPKTASRGRCNRISYANFLIVFHSNCGSLLLSFRDMTTKRTTDVRTDDGYPCISDL